MRRQRRIDNFACSVSFGIYDFVADMKQLDFLTRRVFFPELGEKSLSFFCESLFSILLLIVWILSAPISILFSTGSPAEAFYSFWRSYKATSSTTFFCTLTTRRTHFCWELFLQKIQNWCYFLLRAALLLLNSQTIATYQRRSWFCSACVVFRLHIYSFHRGKSWFFTVKTLITPVSLTVLETFFNRAYFLQKTCESGEKK